MPMDSRVSPSRAPAVEDVYADRAVEDHHGGGVEEEIVGYGGFHLVTRGLLDGQANIL
jgi:hypothetical protein